MSAVGLTATAAWLIATAAQMPSPADLALAAVIVRTLGIGRGVLRYVERLISHDAALGGVASLRARTYSRLDASGPARLLSLHRGDIVARLGGDLDAIGDGVVRALIPALVAVVVSLGSVAIVGTQDARAGLALAACLSVAGAVPWILTRRAMEIAQLEGAVADAAVAVTALDAMEGATEHRVWGTSADAARALDEANRRSERARESAARPGALGFAVSTLGSGVALVAAIAIGVAAVNSGDLSGPAAAIVGLTPLAAFEAVLALPSASQQAFRSRAAADRLAALVGAAPIDEATPASEPVATSGLPSAGGAHTGVLALERLSAAWPGAIPTHPIDAVLSPGSVVGVVGPSGVGKTTLLLTMAGVILPASGRVLLDGHPVSSADTGTRIAMTAEDAHVFGTTILENLRVARGDVSRDEAGAVLATVGLSPWLQRQASGLDTALGSGGLSVSGGERRRLLLARALLHPAPIHLIDEPGEHLDSDGPDLVRALVTEARRAGKSIVIVTHDRSLLDVVDTVVDLA